MKKLSIKKIAINDANNKICFEVKKYIKSLPFKVGDKVSCTRFGICWIASIIPERGSGGYYTGMVVARINPAKKDGTRSNREFVLFSFEVDSIKKID
jgi:hypothetical protein